PAERAGRTELGSSFQPFPGMFLPVAVFLLVRRGATRDLFDLNGHLFLFRLMSLFLLLILELAVIDHFTDRRLCVWGDLDQVDSASPGLLYRVTRVHYAKRVAVIRYHAYRRDADSLIRTVLGLALTRPVTSSTKSSRDIDLLNQYAISESTSQLLLRDHLLELFHGHLADVPLFAFANRDLAVLKLFVAEYKHIRDLLHLCVANFCPDLIRASIG